MRDRSVSYTEYILDLFLSLSSCLKLNQNLKRLKHVSSHYANRNGDINSKIDL